MNCTVGSATLAQRQRDPRQGETHLCGGDYPGFQFGFKLFPSGSRRR